MSHDRDSLVLLDTIDDPASPERLLIRQIVPDDAVAYTNLLHANTIDVAENAHLTLPGFAKGVVTESMIRSRIEMTPLSTLFGLWVFIDGDTALVGALQLDEDDYELGMYETAGWLAPALRGQGLATVALQAIVEYMLQQGDAKAIRSWIPETNRKSRAVIERLGHKLLQCIDGNCIYEVRRSGYNKGND